MSGPFDPYHRWLGIPPQEQPPNHYRLLGIAPFEADPEVIAHAADQRMSHLRTFQSGRHGSESQKLLNEVAAAKVCLLRPDKRAVYDESLRQTLAAEKARPAPEPLPPLPTAEFTQPPPLPQAAPTPAGPIQAVAPERSVAQDHLAQRKRQRQIVAVLGCVTAGLLLAAGLIVLARTRPDEEPVAVDLGKENGPADKAPGDEAQDQRKTPVPPPTTAKQQRPADPARPDRAPGPGQSDPVPEKKPPDAAPPVAVTRPPPKQPPESPPEPEEPQKLPIPSNAVQAEIAARADELYELGKERLPSESLQLAGELFRDAEKAKDKPDERFVMLRKAIDLAVLGGDATLVLAAADAIGADFQVDVVAVKQAYLLKFAERADDSARRKSFVQSSLAVIDQAAAEGRYDVALKIATTADKFCQMPPPNEHREQVADWCRQLNDLCRRQQEFQTAEAALQADPDDPAANLAAGRWCCFVRDDWPRGLPCLAKGSDQALKALAELETTPPADWQAQTKLGDRWWDLAESAPQTDAGGPRRRAAHWYLAAWPGSSGLARAKIKKRLGDVTSQLDRTGTSAKLAVPIYTALLEDATLSSAERTAAQTELARWQDLVARTSPTLDGSRWSSKSKHQQPSQSVDALLAEAAGLVRSGDHQQARRKLLDAFKLNPDDIRAAFTIGLIEVLKEHEPAAAEKRFADCARRQPDHVPSLNNLALTRVRLRRYRQAMRDWESALEAAPATPEINHNLGRCRHFEQSKLFVLDSPTEKSLGELLARAAAGGGHSYARTGWQYMPFSATGEQDAGWPREVSLEDRSCMVCKGLGWVDCPDRSCKRGKVRQPRTRVVGRNPVTGARITESYTVSVDCRVCRGRGKIDCTACVDGIDGNLR